MGVHEVQTWSTGTVAVSAHCKSRAEPPGCGHTHLNCERAERGPRGLTLLPLEAHENQESEPYPRQTGSPSPSLVPGPPVTSLELVDHSRAWEQDRACRACPVRSCHPFIPEIFVECPVSSTVLSTRDAAEHRIDQPRPLWCSLASGRQTD